MILFSSTQLIFEMNEASYRGIFSFNPGSGVFHCDIVLTFGYINTIGVNPRYFLRSEMLSAFENEFYHAIERASCVVDDEIYCFH